MNHFANVLTVALAVAAATASAQIRFPVEAPKAVVGDRMKTAILDGLTKSQTNWSEEVVTAVDTHITTDVRYGTGRPDKFVYDSTWVRLGDVRGQPERQVKLEFPLELGKKWPANYKWVNGRNHDGRMELSYSVRGTERITVPAGTFDTVVVDGKGHWTNVTTSATGSATEVLWFAPQANRIIRRTWVTRFALGGGLDQNWLYEATEVEMKPQ